MAGFASLPLHPDVVPGVRALRQAGLRLVTLSNGSTQVAESLIEPKFSRGGWSFCRVCRCPCKASTIDGHEYERSRRRPNATES